MALDQLIDALTERLREHMNHGPPRIAKPLKYVAGMNFRLWLQSFDEYCEAAGLEEENRRPHLMSLLDLNTAYTAVDNLNLPEELEYAEFSRRLLERFTQHRTPQDYRLELTSRDQQEKESMEAYGDTLLELVRNAYPNIDAEARAELAKDRFMKGVRVSESVREKLFLSQPDTLTAAIRSTRQLDAAMRAAHSGQGSRARASLNAVGASARDEREELEGLRRKVQELERQLQQRYAAQGGSQVEQSRPQQPRGSRGEGVECWRCHQVGHYASQCPGGGAQEAGGGQGGSSGTRGGFPSNRLFMRRGNGPWGTPRGK